MRSVPLRVSRLGLVRCLACFWGAAARSLFAFTWLWAVCPLVGGPRWGGGGRGLCAVPPKGVAGGP